MPATTLTVAFVAELQTADCLSPGGYLDPSESDEEGLITRLNETFGEPDGKGGVKAKKQDWVVGELLSTWWRPKFDNYMAGLLQL